MQRILITGGSGFLGRYLNVELSTKYETLSVGRTHGEIVCDLSKQEPVFPRVDMVVHAAGQAHIQGKLSQCANIFEKNNCLATQNLLSSLAANNVPKSFVYISTVAVYGLVTGEDIREDYPTCPNTHYGRTKAECEKLIVQWGQKHDVPVVILRLPLLIGLDAPGNLGRMIQSVQRKTYVSIGTGMARKSMVLAMDVARIVPKLLGREGTYHLTDGEHPRIRDIEEALVSRFQKKIRMKVPTVVAKGLAQIGDFSHGMFPFTTETFEKLTLPLTFNDQKARDELGWNPSSTVSYLSGNFEHLTETSV